MIKHIQTILHGNPEGKEGNCWQTAIASILDMPVDEVPHFVQIHQDGGLNWWLNTRYWVKEQGYEIRPVPTHPDTDEYYLVSGPSPRGADLYHVVIYQRGRMVHDPHPDGTGILEEQQFEVIRKRD